MLAFLAGLTFSTTFGLLVAAEQRRENFSNSQNIHTISEIDKRINSGENFYGQVIGNIQSDKETNQLDPVIYDRKKFSCFITLHSPNYLNRLDQVDAKTPHSFSISDTSNSEKQLTVNSWGLRMEDKFTEKRFIIHNLVKFKSLLDCVGSLYQEKKISQGDKIFIIGNIKKHDDGSLTIESPIDPMLPFTISNEPNWRSGRGILISVLSLQFFSCISSAVLLFSIFYEFLKPIFPRTIRTLNFAPYVVKIDTNSSSFAVLANVEVKRPNHKLYYEEALTALKQNNIYDEKILPSYITENAKSVSFIYLYHKSRTTSTGYLVYLLRGLSVVLSAYAFLSLVDTISFHNRHFGKA